MRITLREALKWAVIGLLVGWIGFVIALAFIAMSNPVNQKPKGYKPFSELRANQIQQAYAGRVTG